MVLCASVPRFELLASCSGGWEVLRSPVALAPEPGSQAIGQPSRAAETYGVRERMRLGEALARCPGLELVPPDPERVAGLWEEILVRLEGIGAAVEPDRPGEACFEAGGLLALHGDLDGVALAARKALGLHRAIAAPARIAVAPSRFAASAAAGLEEASGVPELAERGPAQARYRLVAEGGERRFLSPLPVSVLTRGMRRRGPGSGSNPSRGSESAGRPVDGEDAGRVMRLIGDLERLGIGTLGALADLGPDAVADRFGRVGSEARRLALGGRERLHPRTPAETLEESLELPDSLDGPPLESALGALIDRLLALPARRGRTLRSLSLSALLAGGGSWRTEVALNVPTASSELLRLVLMPRLGALPGPASRLTLRAEELGREEAEQGQLLDRPGERRRERLGEAVRQTRAAAGADSVLQVMSLDSRARLPESRAILSPFGDAGRESERRGSRGS